MAAIAAGTGVPAGGSTYTHEYTITLGNSGQIPSTQTNYPVLVCANLTLGNGNACATATGLKATGSGGAVTSSSAYDVVFSSTACASATLLNWEMVSYVGSTGAMEAWVKVPSLAAGGSLYICAGNSLITTFQGGATGAAWDSNYVSVYHFGGSSLSPNDSTANAYNLSPTSSPTTATGQVNGGVATNGSSSYLSGTPSGTPGAITLEAWVYTVGTSYDQEPLAIATGGGSTTDTLAGLRITGATTVDFYMYSDDLTETVSSLTNTWSHLALTVDASRNQIAYQNGASVGSRTASGVYTGGIWTIVGAGSGTFNYGYQKGFNGTVDEARISKTARSANWLAIGYHQCTPASFMTVALTY